MKTVPNPNWVQTSRSTNNWYQTDLPVYIICQKAYNIGTLARLWHLVPANRKRSSWSWCPGSCPRTQHDRPLTSRKLQKHCLRNFQELGIGDVRQGAKELPVWSQKKVGTWVVNELSSSKYGPGIKGHIGKILQGCSLDSGCNGPVMLLGSPTVTGVVDAGLLHSQVIICVGLQSNLSCWPQNSGAIPKAKHLKRFKLLQADSSLVAVLRIQQFDTRWHCGQVESTQAPVSTNPLR